MAQVHSFSPESEFFFYFFFFITKLDNGCEPSEKEKIRDVKNKGCVMYTIFYVVTPLVYLYIVGVAL